MEMSGERMIAAERAAVWAALNDPGVLKACIPGCQTLEKTSDTTLEAQVTQKIGPVKATFNGTVEITDIVETESYTISGEGKGGAAGFAKGSARVVLSDAEGGTHLAYEAEAKVGGKLAQLGSRLVGGVARKMADEFFTRFQEEVEEPSDSGAAEEDGDAPAPAGAEDPPAATEPTPARTDPAAPAPESAASAPESAASAPEKPEKKKGWLARLFG